MSSRRDLAANPFANVAYRLADERRDETMGVRLFPGLDGVGYDPKENWGMEYETPDWIDKIHNTHQGRCFMLGTGPSLIDQLPMLKRLEGEYTFTCNRAHLWKELPFTPFVHYVSEPGPLVAWGAGVGSNYDFPEAQNRIACIWTRVTAPGWLWLPKAPDDIQLRWQGAWGMGDFLPPIPTAWASPLTMSQLALWMGFTEIIILGCDISQTGQSWDREKGTTKFPRNIRSILECADRLSRDVWRHGREIWDCTPGGRLNVEGAMKYRDLEDVLCTKTS